MTNLQLYDTTMSIWTKSENYGCSKEKKGVPNKVTYVCSYRQFSQIIYPHDQILTTVYLYVYLSAPSFKPKLYTVYKACCHHAIMSIYIYMFYVLKSFK